MQTIKASVPHTGACKTGESKPHPNAINFLASQIYPCLQRSIALLEDPAINGFCCFFVNGMSACLNCYCKIMTAEMIQIKKAAGHRVLPSYIPNLFVVYFFPLGQKIPRKDGMVDETHINKKRCQMPRMVYAKAS